MTTWNQRSSVSTNYTARSTVSTTYSTRPVLNATVVAPIITSFWDDLATWSETGKFWIDEGDLGTSWTGRVTP